MPLCVPNIPHHWCPSHRVSAKERMKEQKPENPAIAAPGRPPQLVTSMADDLLRLPLTPRSVPVTASRPWSAHPCLCPCSLLLSPLLCPGMALGRPV